MAAITPAARPARLRPRLGAAIPAAGRLAALLIACCAAMPPAAGEVTVFPAAPPAPAPVPVPVPVPGADPDIGVPVWAYAAAPRAPQSDPAPDPVPATVLHVYSALDLSLARPLIAGFQAAHPGVAVAYDSMLTGEIHDRIVTETDGGQRTADFAFSSAMDLQVKLANDGYARRVAPPDAGIWPRWANWRGRAWALTFEPAVFVYNRAAFAGSEPPATRAALKDWLDSHPAAARNRIGTYDIERAGAGFLFLARDQEHFADIWGVVRAMGRAGAQTYPTSREILERVADGRLVLGYNILGSYAALWARSHPQVGVALPRDYTVVVSRVGLVPRAAAAPELGERFLAFLMSEAGQTIMARDLDLPAVRPGVTGGGTAESLLSRFGSQLRPVPLGPGLLVYLDQAKRARLARDWSRALAGTPPG